MSLTPITVERFAAELGLARGDDGLPPFAGLAALLRRAVARWGASRPTTLMNYARRTLRACGYEDEAPQDRAKVVRDALIHLRDLAVAWSEPPPESVKQMDDADTPAPLPLDGKLLLPTVSRAVLFGDWALLSGTAEPAGSTRSFGTPYELTSIARWVRWDEAREDELESEGFKPCELTDWLGPSGALEHLERRGGTESDSLWKLLQRDFDASAGPLDAPEQIAVLAGPPGGLFGRHAELTGRWRPGDDVPAGRWLARGRGYGAQATPLLVQATGGRAVQGMRLFDHDEWCWALLDRGRQLGAPEVARGRSAVKLTCPLPAQSEALGTLSKRDKWIWTFPPWIEEVIIHEELVGRFFLALED